MLKQPELNSLLENLIHGWENEVVEFKQARSSYETEKIGKYFSALSNEANLRGLDCAWLVFGIDDKTRTVTGTNYRSNFERLQSLNVQISQSTEPRSTFRNIHELTYSDERVIVFEIPAAPRGFPVSWKGHYFARAGESLVPMGLDKQDEIRRQDFDSDWTAKIVPDATFNDLDEEALQKARKSFAEKHSNRLTLEQVLAWPLEIFLERARITRNGRITRTAILLLGRAESSSFLSPHLTQLTWKLVGTEKAYEHFSTPFLINASRLYQRIRNIQIRLLPYDKLVAVEIPKYDRKIVMEALHNCIAHQDYFRNSRIIVTEELDRLVFQNVGSFFDGQPADYIEGNRTPNYYRNPFLTQAMVQLNMIDNIGYGIHNMFARQAERYFPLPDYDLSENNAVRLTVFGSVMDSAYTELLLNKTDLPLTSVLALDRVQKKLPIPNDVAAKLRREGLIEGRKPNYHVSADIAQITSKRAEYIRTRSLEDEFYAKLLIDYLEKFGQATRSEINILLLNKLSESLNEDQKLYKVSNLLAKLQRQKLIRNIGSRSDSCWVLTES